MLSGQRQIAEKKARDKVQSLFPGLDFKLLNTTNNLIYLVRSSSAQKVVKIITDNGIDTAYLAQSMRELGKVLSVPEVYDVITPASEEDFGAIVMEYIDGISLAEKEAFNEKSVASEFADTIIKCLKSTPGITPYFEGPGIFKKGTNPYEKWSFFIQSYFEKYLGRVKETYANKSFIDSIETWAEPFHSAFEKMDCLNTYVVTPIDLNLRNYVLSGNRIVLLNIPIMANSLIDHGVGSVMAQTAGTPAEYSVKLRLRQHALDSRLATYFDVWMALGILSFYASQRSVKLDTAVNWGSSVPLIARITKLIAL